MRVRWWKVDYHDFSRWAMARCISFKTCSPVTTWTPSISTGVKGTFVQNVEYIHKV